MPSESLDQKLPHVVLLPFPLLGHLLPAMELARRLASSGLVVSFMCPEHRMENLQKAHAAEGGNPRIQLVTLPDMVPKGDVALDEGLESIVWTLQGTEKVAEVCEKLIQGMMKADLDDHYHCHHEDSDRPSGIPRPGPPVCIISEPLMSWSQDVANRQGIQRYVFDPSPAAIMCTILRLPGLVLEGRLPLRFSPPALKDEDPTNRLITVPGLPWPLHETDFHSSFLDITPTSLHEPFVRHSLRVTEASGVLINTFYELEPLAIASLRTQSPPTTSILPVGPLLPPLFLKHDPTDHTTTPAGLLPDDRKCLEWLDTQPTASVLYVSFGSMGAMPVDQIYELALGLEASTHPFLWVIRRKTQTRDPHARPPVDDLLPQGFLHRTQNQGLVVSSWAPQLLILSHPATGSFLSHCGWNSTLESISMGVPMLASPLYADQRLNCRILVEELKIAVEVQRSEKGLLLKEEVEKKVRMALMGGGEGEAMRERARRLRDAARKSVEAEGSSQKHLEEFVQSMYEKAKVERTTFNLH